jgi:hypothetical protein
MPTKVTTQVVPRAFSEFVVKRLGIECLTISKGEGGRFRVDGAAS